MEIRANFDFMHARMQRMKLYACHKVAILAAKHSHDREGLETDRIYRYAYIRIRVVCVHRYAGN